MNRRYNQIEIIDIHRPRLCKPGWNSEAKRALLASSSLAFLLCLVSALRGSENMGQR